MLLQQMLLQHYTIRKNIRANVVGTNIARTNVVATNINRTNAVRKNVVRTNVVRKNISKMGEQYLMS